MVMLKCCKKKNILWVLTNVWRGSGEGVAQILSAAVHKQAVKFAEALLHVVNFGETAPLLMAVNPGVEADVSFASSIHACAFAILARTQHLPIVFGI